MKRKKRKDWTGFRGEVDKVVLFCRMCEVERVIQLPIDLAELPKLAKAFNREHEFCDPSLSRPQSDGGDDDQG